MPLNLHMKSARWMVALAAAAGALISASHDAKARGIAAYVTNSNVNSCKAPSGNFWYGFAGGYAWGSGYQCAVFNQAEAQGSTAFTPCPSTTQVFDWAIVDVGNNFSNVGGPGSTGTPYSGNGGWSWAPAAGPSTWTYNYTSSSGVSCSVSILPWTYQ